MITIYILINTNDLAVTEAIAVKKTLQTFQIIRLLEVMAFFHFLFFFPSTICSCLFGRFLSETVCLVPFFSGRVLIKKICGVKKRPRKQLNEGNTEQQTNRFYLITINVNADWKFINDERN